MIEYIVENKKNNVSDSSDRTALTSPLISEGSPPEEVLSNPALLFLYYRIEQILGIKAGTDALIKLNEFLEKKSTSTFIKNPSAYDYLLTSREHIYKIAKFITVNETYFFREGCHFELLSLFLPDYSKLKRPLQICCAAVSIGCEAYSIAMLLDFYNKKGIELEYCIDAFDIDAEVIEIAKEGRYTANTFRTDTSSWRHILDSYLILDNNTYVVPQIIRKKVNFFPHNIMRGLNKHYDVIFFRNSLIYFTSKNRLSVINNLSDALFSNGLLFLGISETASIKHPLLASCFTNNIFYFQKIPSPIHTNIIRHELPDQINKVFTESKEQEPDFFNTSIPQSKETEILVNCSETANVLKKDEGKTNAQNVLEKINESSNTETISFCGSSFAAAVSYYLNTEDFKNANLVLNILEKHNKCALTLFLRAEYYYLTGNTEKAENIYQEVTFKDKFFWPAFYRIAVIASDGNITRFEYKINKTIDSIELMQKEKKFNQEYNYECFMGGFSPDYFIRILENKLAEKRGN
ncbi:MAG: hypothetical protein FWB86_08560 [Treponema sp.]|nr:hypothetical protein [Treponema sp.]MCL2252067.1 hypothetical protein [Treponema sp.]